ncbi:MAG: DUF4838 domain-containing protein [Clostridiales bacterium]|nr:DUF4838 domain-containing protein [Clostridiales bacterium]
MKILNRFGYRVICTMLAAVMFISVFTGITVSAAPTQEVVVSSNITCEFDSNFSLVYYIKIESTGNFTNPYLKVAFHKYSGEGGSYTRETTTIKDYTYDESTKQYRFVFSGISAAEMGNTAYATFCASIGSQAYASSVIEYSVKKYAEDVLSYKMSSNTDADKKLCTLMVDLLNYGAAAQTYFGRHTNVLANKDLTSAQKAVASALPSSASTCLKKGSFTNPKATLQKIALSFDNSVDPVVYASFTSAPSSNVYAELSYKDIEGAQKKIRVNSSDFGHDTETGLYRMEFEGISPLYFKTPFTVVFKEGNNAISATTTYSVESYAHDILAGNYNSQVKDLVKKLLAYGGAARAFYDAYGSPEQPVIDDSISTYKNSKYTKDMPKAVIVIPSSASKEEQYAANMIQRYMSRKENYTPKIVKDSVAKGSQGFEISVGNTNRPHGSAKYSSDGSYKIYYYSDGAGGISIKGVGKRGTINGAGKFLSLCGGYFWLSMEDGYKSNQTNFKYETNINYDYQRPFTFTDIDAAYGVMSRDEYGMFDVANGLNGYYANIGAGDESWYLYSDKNTATYSKGQVHTLLTEYFHESDLSSNPGWFTTAKFSTAQVCLSNKQVRARILSHVKEILNSSKYNPNAPMQIISLSQADNSNYCTCQACKDFVNSHKSDQVNASFPKVHDYSPLYIDLCNEISEAIHQNGAYKNVYIDTLAYDHTIKPPKGLKINKYVIVRYAALMRCYAHNCDDTTCMRNLEDSTYLKTWANLCNQSGAQLWIWDYNANWYSTIMPYANIRSAIHDIRYYKSLGVKGIYLQSNDIHLDCNSEFGDLRLYIEGVLLENPDADVDKEIEFFLNEFYGAGAPYIKEYLDLMVKQAKNHQCGSNCSAPYQWRLFCLRYDSKPGQIFNNEMIDYDGTNYTTSLDAHNRMPDSDINRCEEIYNAAMKAVENDSERHRFTTGRTLVSWKLVKSVLKVKEFANASTYKSQNAKLYKELVETYKVTVFSLIWRTRTDTKLDKNPGEWVVK